MQRIVSYICVAILLVGVCVPACAQFSPGDLSKAHQHLEGMGNCLQCHESGNEISGAKCLTCHQEIKASLDAKRGYHFKISNQQCVACHKEHLGREAQTMLFDKNTFDHSQTGFGRTGKHATTACEDCHAKKNITNARILEIVSKQNRQTFLGLSQACVSCHPDRHNGTVGVDCKRCHDTKSFSPVSASFDHAKTKLRLSGKHATLACNKCHTTLEQKVKGKPLLFVTKDFGDCSPCHVSPHSVNFVKAQPCGSCHSPENWKTGKQSGKFNHDLTQFKLVGRHALVACEQCHKEGARSSLGGALKLAHNRCVDCHSDYHRGEFAVEFQNDCAKCHTASGFKPSTFTVLEHNAGRFPLRGAHLATPCEKCHAVGGDGRKPFRFSNIRCEACHKDKHGGQFARDMATQSCAACHSTDDWFPKSFDHSKTSFALVGKHATAECKNCHKVKHVGGVEIALYRGTTTKCESCHKEVHAGQFATNGGTECASCHTPMGWKMLVFNHEKQSAFVLTGAHKRIECRRCHKEERRGETSFIRYKPLSTKCESCHAQGTFGNG